MLSPGDHELHQSWATGELTGCWMLPPGQVLSLRPHRAGVLRIRHGRAWVTLGERPRGHGALAGDHFLLSGEQLGVPAGRHLVLQSLDGGAIGFEWGPAAQGQPGPLRLALADLWGAAQLAARAVQRLLRGLAAWPEGLRLAGVRGLRRR